MNIGKVMQFATEGLKAVQSLPLAGKVVVGTLFVGGDVAGILIGDSFEKEVGGKEEVKEETELVTQPKEQADTAKVKAKKPEFKYIPPKVGAPGIASSDTIPNK